MPLEVLLIIFQFVVLIAAFAVHECAHAWAAWRLGDPTAYMLGRVTLNPLKHIDPLGSVVFPIISLVYGGLLFGWAKPCPVTTRNFKHVRRDDILTTIAGPVSNLISAAVALILLLVLKHAIPGGAVSVQAAMLIASGFKNIATDSLPQLFPVALLLYYGIVINLLLFVFNLLPVPPLDGSRILRYFLPYNVEKIYDNLGWFGLIFIMFIGGPFIIRIVYLPLRGIFDTVLASL